MRTDIREMPLCLENVKNLLWPPLSSSMTGFQSLASGFYGVAFWFLLSKELGDTSERQLLALDSYEERGEAKVQLAGKYPG